MSYDNTLEKQCKKCGIVKYIRNFRSTPSNQAADVCDSCKWKEHDSKSKERSRISEYEAFRTKSIMSDTPIDFPVFEDKKDDQPKQPENVLTENSINSESPNSGYIYIFTTRAMPDFCKIGRTKKVPEHRAAELSTSTAIPIPFQVYFTLYVSDCFELEKKIHNELSNFRENNNRDFFRISPKAAKEVIERLINTK